jgi:hypothetical protein
VKNVRVTIHATDGGFNGRVEVEHYAKDAAVYLAVEDFSAFDGVPLRSVAILTPIEARALISALRVCLGGDSG